MAGTVRGRMGRYEIALQLETSEVPRLIDWAERTAASEGITPEITFKLMLALEEAVTNVIGHAFVGIPPPQVLRVLLDIGPEALTAEVIDNGRAFDPSAAPEPDLTRPIEERQPGGLGIHLMRRMMDRIDYQRADGCNRLILVKFLKNPPAATRSERDR